jgi:hypothetical protein
MLNESSPDTPLGSISPDLNLSKLWLCNMLKKFELTKFDNIYILGSWYGSMGLFLLTKGIEFDDAYNIDWDHEKTTNVMHMLKRMKLNDCIHAVRADANDIEYKGDCLVINTSTNDIEGRDWFDNIPSDTPVVLQGKSDQEKSNGEDTMEKFNRAYPLSQTLLLDFLTVEDVKGNPYSRFMKIGYK